MRRVALINPLSLIPVPRALDERTGAAKSQGQPLRFRLPLFGDGGMIAVWATGQIHPDISQVT
jgi:hypothetical protein